MPLYLSPNVGWKPLANLMRCCSFPPASVTLSAAAALSGGFAWSPLGIFALLPVFALAYGWAGSKRQQIAVIIGYYLGALWSLNGVFDGFWPDASPWVGWAGWVGTALLIAVPWMLLVFIGPDTAMMRGLRFFISMLISALPPLGAYGLASPWIFVSAWFPGTGIAGLAMGALWISMLAAWAKGMHASYERNNHTAWGVWHTRPNNKTRLADGILVFGAIWAVAANIAYLPPAKPQHWAAVHTNLAGFRGPVAAPIWMHRQVRVAQIVRTAILSNPNHTRILFPESTAGPQFHNFFSALMDNGMASMAREHGDTLLIGADDLANQKGDYTDSLNIMGQYHGRISARQPAPFGEWRPWGRHTALADWWHFGGYQIGKESVAWAVCYEQMLVWPIAWNFLGDGHKPSVLLAPSDHDWARGIMEPAVQKQALMAWARLYQIPELYANDGPQKPKHSRSNPLAKRQ